MDFHASSERVYWSWWSAEDDTDSSHIAPVLYLSANSLFFRQSHPPAPRLFLVPLLYFIRNTVVVRHIYTQCGIVSCVWIWTTLILKALKPGLSTNTNTKVRLFMHVYETWATYIIENALSMWINGMKTVSIATFGHFMSLLPAEALFCLSVLHFD